MNFGDCPYSDCDELLFLEVPDKTPQFKMFQCDKCGRNIWYKFSRIEPQAWTEKDFESRFEIDHKNKTIKEKTAA